MDLQTDSGSDDINKFLTGLNSPKGADSISATPPKEKSETQPNQSIDKILQSMPKMPDPPKLHDIPTAQDQQFHSPFKDFSGPMIFLAALGSLMTRHPAKVAMDSFSAMVNANVAGQKDVIQQARENMKAATETVIKQNEVEIERYKLVMEKHKDDASQVAAAMMAQASGFNDPMMQAMVKTGNMANVWSYIQDREKRGDQLREFQLKQATEREHERHDRAMEGQGEDIENRAQAIAAGKLPPPSPNNKNPQIQRIMERVLEINPNFDATTFAGHQSSFRAFSSGKEAQLVRSMNVSVNHLNTFERLGKALQNNDVQALNRIKNEWSAQFGGTAPTNFDTAKIFVSDEVLKAIIGAGGGVTDRDAFQKKFDSAKTPGQLLDVIGLAKEFMAGQLDGLRKEYEVGTGRNDFDQRLTPAAREAVGSLGGGKGTESQEGWKIEEVK